RWAGGRIGRHGVIIDTELRRSNYNSVRATTKVVWQNIPFGVAFIVTTMTLAIWGPLTPITAAVAHTVATAVVIFNSARLVRYGEERATELESYLGPFPAQPAVAA
ncbi:MAG: hypothetical protein Q7R41_17445, partial [Phycisphaerales bacterium]|nr:hypothetical protein [Phycisphaerales bacterium]